MPESITLTLGGHTVTVTKLPDGSLTVAVATIFGDETLPVTAAQREQIAAFIAVPA